MAPSGELLTGGTHMRSPLEDYLTATEASTPAVFAARACATPQARFLSYEGDEWTYEMAWATIRRYARLFSSLGSAGRSGRVASYLTNRPEGLWAWFGTHVAGKVYIPLNRAHKGALLQSLIERTGAEVLVTEANALSELGFLQQTSIRTVVVCDSIAAGALPPSIEVVKTQAAEAEPPYEAPRPSPHSLATIMFTSGTTGRSKAVRIPHAMLCRGAARIARAFGATEKDTFHLWMPLFHVGAQLHQTLAMVVAGGSVALFPTFSRRSIWRQVRETNSTLLCGFPHMLKLIWTLPAAPDDAKSSLRAVLSGGVPEELHRAFEARFGVEILDTYGMTEVEPITLPTRNHDTPIGSCGIANPDFQVAIVDDKDQLLPPGEVGEVVVRPNEPSLMMMGYEDDDAETVARSRNLWWHTGDLGRQDARGFFYILGRIKEMIRRRGENISTWELEALITQHESVAECAVVGVPSPLGEEDVKAVVIPRNETRLDAATIYRFCTENMAKFMVPRFIEIRAELPRNEVGKVDKLKLVPPGPEVWDSEKTPFQEPAHFRSNQ